jgi:nifR3 family TIM-barrel protein
MLFGKDLMHQSFWSDLPRPFFVLAPLADVTDAAFRRVIATYAKPHVLWTEFTSAEGLYGVHHASLWCNLLYSEVERPIVAQLWSANPAAMEQAAALVARLGFDGIDINMGCPDRRVERRGAGAALCRQPALAQALIRAAQRGADALPVSVKIRLGYARDELDTWLPALLETQPAAITIHARTRQEKSDVPAHWDAVARAVRIRQAQGSSTLLIGNGDVRDTAEARVRACDTGVDGVMLGRAIFGNPWLFHPTTTRDALPAAERLRVLVEHTQLFETLLGDIKSMDRMKKHYKAYLSGLKGADTESLWQHLMASHSAAEVAAIVERMPLHDTA